ncbi:MAG TPA: cupin domain-containing protein [Devosiaceae bacterium]|jgi:quercetin dioxygenase-like cupin family protein|nr:cupin domain-containing protein [Devosiaceae bacterium]
MHLNNVRGGFLLAAVALGTVFAATASAHDGHHLALTGEDVEFKPGPPTLPPGAEIAVLHGNPAEEGQFVFRLKFPAGYEIPPHRHPKEEHVTVISGGFGMSTGETFERGAAPVLPAGGFMRIPVGKAHFAWTEEPTVVQLNGIGPFGVEYVNPEDDPRNK